LKTFLEYEPRVVAALQPWAEISQRLRRFFKLLYNAISALFQNCHTALRRYF
jgi:hypothetical protein